jgi:hypothetical protein
VFRRERLAGFGEALIGGARLSGQILSPGRDVSAWTDRAAWTVGIGVGTRVSRHVRVTMRTGFGRDEFFNLSLAPQKQIAVVAKLGFAYSFGIP